VSRYYKRNLREHRSLNLLFRLMVGGMSEGVDIVVGRRLRARRRLLGMSQQTLGSACGVTFQQIHKYESAVCRLSANMLWKLACVLEVEMSYFFADLPRIVTPQAERQGDAAMPPPSFLTAAAGRGLDART
jgi:transcriptional regulator with XRE-family HTH domain